MIVQHPPFTDRDRCENYVLGMPHRAEQLHFVVNDGGGPRLSSSGLREFAELRAAGYRPKKRLALSVLAKLTTNQREARMMWKMIQRLEATGVARSERSGK